MKENCQDPHAFHEADIAFHKAILAATHNVVIQQLSDAISALQRTIFGKTFLTEAHHMELTIEEHRALFDAIWRKEPLLAEQASHKMVNRTENRARKEKGSPVHQAA